MSIGLYRCCDPRALFLLASCSPARSSKPSDGGLQDGGAPDSGTDLFIRLMGGGRTGDWGMAEAGMQVSSSMPGTEPDDGGDLNAGSEDAGPEDGGDADAGIDDAGTPGDAGPEDAGSPLDAGVDAGHRDGGREDGGVDAGHRDGGREDAGREDAGIQDAGVEDAGPKADAGPDSGSVTDAGNTLDAGTPPVDAGCVDGSIVSCSTSCGSVGSATCTAGSYGPCVPPAEICNLQDDDCSGSCDDILGCRIGVDRSDDSSRGWHFYTTTDSEASCCGYHVEAYDYFFLYAAAQTGLVPFYRCLNISGSHRYTTDASCDGGTSEGSMGWIADGEVCGSVPLYGLHDATSDDYFYTTSSSEASSAEAGGYASEGIAGYVWPAICGGTGCTWPNTVDMVGSTTTAATGFPTTWYGFPIEPGNQSFSALAGTVSVTNSADIYSEVLFILEVLPSGCSPGMLPASTPEYGPPGAAGLVNFIVKSPERGHVQPPG